MATVTGVQEFSWTANAASEPPQCGGLSPGARTRSVKGSGSFSLSFSTPRAYRMETVQVLQRAYQRHPQRTLSYRPAGAPRLEDHVQFPAAVNIAGAFTDEILACDAFDASTVVAPTSGCGAQAATLDLEMSFGVIGATTRNDADLQGKLVSPWFLDADARSTCPTFRSVALGYFNGGLDTPACPSTTALDPYFGPPESGIATYFHKGRFYRRLTSAHPKAFVLTADVPMQCTLTARDSDLPALPPSGTLTITGRMQYVWSLVPRRITDPSSKVRPL